MAPPPPAPDRLLPVRFALYAAALVGGGHLLVAAVVARGTGFAAEDGPLELAQVAVAAGGAALLILAAHRTAAGRAGLAACAGALLYAAARECDGWFERTFFDDAYKYLAGLPIAAAVGFIAWRDRRNWPESLRWCGHPSAGLFLCGGLQVVAVAALLERPALWLFVDDFDQAEAMKRVVEECCELAGYAALAAGSLELFLTVRGENAAAAAQAARPAPAPAVAAPALRAAA